MPLAQRGKNDAIGIKICYHLRPFRQIARLFHRQGGAKALPIRERHQHFTLFRPAFDVVDTSGQLVVGPFRLCGILSNANPRRFQQH